MNGRRKVTILLFLREARFINREDDVRNGRSVYARIVGLKTADLRKAHLRGAKLISTHEDEPISLKGAILEGADLRDAVLKIADLQGADLQAAVLEGADLSGVNLTGARVTEEHLATCKSLEGATMHNGEKHEDWLKARGGEEAENSDLL